MQNYATYASKAKTEARKGMKKYTTYQYLVEATQMPNSNIN